MIIEELVIQYLDINGIEAFGEVPTDKPNEYVVIEKISDYPENQINYCTFGFDIYSKSMLSTAQLADKVKKLMPDIIKYSEDVSKCSVENVYNNTDTVKKEYKYYGEFDLVYY